MEVWEWKSQPVEGTTRRKLSQNPLFNECLLLTGAFSVNKNSSCFLSTSYVSRTLLKTPHIIFTEVALRIQEFALAT